jgi:hypothetical protein
MEELVNKIFEKQPKCSSCMIGKSTLDIIPTSNFKADCTLKQVNADSFSPSVTTIEGCNQAIVSG